MAKKLNAAEAAMHEKMQVLKKLQNNSVRSEKDVQNLKALGRSNLRAAIVGKALYDGRTTLKEMNLAAL